MAAERERLLLPGKIGEVARVRETDAALEHAYLVQQQRPLGGHAGGRGRGQFA